MSLTDSPLLDSLMDAHLAGNAALARTTRVELVMPGDIWAALTCLPELNGSVAPLVVIEDGPEVLMALTAMTPMGESDLTDSDEEVAERSWVADALYEAQLGTIRQD